MERQDKCTNGNKACSPREKRNPRPVATLFSCVAVLSAAPSAAGPLSAAVRPLEFRLSDAYRNCIKLSGGATQAQIDCAEEEYVRLDQTLNQSWQATLARLPDKAARTALRRDQREWLRTRWIECDERVAQSGVAGSESAILIYDACRLEVVARRISLLKTWGSVVLH